MGSAKIKVTVKARKKSTNPTETGDTPKPEPDVSKPVHTPKSLVVYFSCTDTTKKIAEYVQESAGADIYRIEAEVPYTAEDLNYGDSSTRATREQNDSSDRPAISGTVSNMQEYDFIFLSYPKMEYGILLCI